MSDTLLAGVGQRDITPRAGFPMAAFPVERDPWTARVAEGVHDHLSARALALSDAKETIVVCVADVIGFQWRDVDPMRVAFAEQTGLPPESLVVCGTHNHNGPECSYLAPVPPDNPYLDRLREGVVGAAVDAYGEMRPARLAVGAVQANLATNRRLIRCDGVFESRGRPGDRECIFPTDPKVSVVRLDTEGGGPLAAVMHFAAHPVINTTPNRLFTAGFPGAAVRHFESSAGMPGAMFLQGACGDTTPYQSRAETWEAVEEMGMGLAGVAKDAWAGAGEQSDVGVTTRRWTAELPHRISAEHMVRIEVTVVRLSPQLALVFWQGEPFVELSLALQWRSPFARTVVMGYAAGGIGYVAPRYAYESGGYGVDAYPTDPPEISRTSVQPGAGELIVDQTAEMLTALS